MKGIRVDEESNWKLTVSTHQTVCPFVSLELRQLQPGASNDTSVFAFFSSPLALAITTLAHDVTMTKRCRFFTELLPKNREKRLGVSMGAESPPPLAAPLEPFELGGAGPVWTIRLPSFNMRSFVPVSTGDHSMSIWLGGGSSVIKRGCGRMLPLLVEVGAGGRDSDCCDLFAG